MWYLGEFVRIMADVEMSAKGGNNLDFARIMTDVEIFNKWESHQN